MGRYRSRLEIIADVLDVVREGARKTRIMYQANLSYQLLMRYLEDVVNMGLARMEGAGHYELTKKGFGFLQEFKGYYERLVEVEEQLSNVEDEKTRLEDRFLNAESTDSSMKEPPSKKGEKV